MAQAVSMHARSSNIITVLAPISVADLRSDSSQVQSSFSSTTGKAHTTRLLAQTHVCLTHGSTPQPAVSAVRTHPNSTKEIQQFCYQSNHATSSITHLNLNDTMQK